jgi:hypothetical protein
VLSLPSTVSSIDLYTFFSGLEIVRLFGCCAAGTEGEDNAGDIDIFIEFSDVATAVAAARLNGELLIIDDDGADHDNGTVEAVIAAVTPYEIVWVCGICIRWGSSVERNLINMKHFREYLPPQLVSSTVGPLNPVNIVSDPFWVEFEDELYCSSDNNASASASTKTKKALSAYIDLSATFPLMGSVDECRRGPLPAGQRSLGDLVDAQARDFSFSEVFPSLERVQDVASVNGDRRLDDVDIKNLKLLQCSKLDKLRHEKTSSQLKFKNHQEKTARLVANAMSLHATLPTTSSQLFCKTMTVASPSSDKCLNRSSGEQYERIQAILALISKKRDKLNALLSLSQSSAVCSYLFVGERGQALKEEISTARDSLCVLSRARILMICLQYIVWQKIIRRSGL